MILLSRALKWRYERHKNILDLARAIGHVKTALRDLDDHIQQGFKLRYLSQLLRLRFARLGGVNGADAAADACLSVIENYQIALLTIPENPSRRLILLHALTDELTDRSERPGGQLSDLVKAIEYGEAARHEITELVFLRSVTLGRLARCFFLRYQRLQALDDLQSSIQHCEGALGMLPAEAQTIPERELRAQALFYLSACLKMRYTTLGAESDSNAAITHAAASSAATPKFSIESGRRLRNWSSLLSLRYYRSRTLIDLVVMIMRSEAALLASEEDNFDIAEALTTHALNLRFRYYAFGGVKDIETALKQARRALALIPVGHIRWQRSLCNLANLLRTRYSVSRNLADYDEAVELTQEAVGILPMDHVDGHNVLTAAAAALGDRFNATGSLDDRKQAFTHLLAAYNCIESPPLLCVVRAREIIENFRELQTLDESSTLLEEAVLLIPRITLRFLGREDLQHLSQLNGLPSEAASFALEAGRDASDALKLLELGRGIITSFGIDSRSELTELEETHRELFQSFTSLRAVMNSTEGEPQDGEDGMMFKSNIHFSAKRMQATVDIEPVLDEIRQIPDYERFLLPSTPAELMKTAEGGTIVVVNTTDLRSDAIIVTTSAITELALPKLVFAEAKHRMQHLPRLAQGKRSTYPMRTTTMTELLAWLWDVVVEPVLGELQPHGIANQAPLPRVWWIGAGVLGRAPFHAAGRDHSASSTSNTLNRVVYPHNQGPCIRAEKETASGEQVGRKGSPRGHADHARQGSAAGDAA